MKGKPNAIDEMLECHSEILRQSRRLEEALEGFRKGGSREDLRLTLDVFLLFTRTTLKLHKRDEEELLFPCLADAGFPGKDLERLMAEHEEFSALDELVGLARDFGKGGAPAMDARLMESLGKLKAHMKEEEDVIFSMAREKLSEKDMEKISERMKALRG